MRIEARGKPTVRRAPPHAENETPARLDVSISRFRRVFVPRLATTRGMESVGGGAPWSRREITSYNSDAIRTTTAAVPRALMPAMSAITCRRNHWRRSCCAGVSRKASSSSATCGDGSTTGSDATRTDKLPPSKKESSTSGRAPSPSGQSVAEFVTGSGKLAGAGWGATSAEPAATAAIEADRALSGTLLGTTASRGLDLRRCCLRWRPRSFELRVPLAGARSVCCFLARLDMDPELSRVPALNAPWRFEVPLSPSSRVGLSGTSEADSLA
jgi:hypothetical protein